jgi:hypothetical protein
MVKSQSNLLLQYRVVMGFFIIALIMSGITAFPLLTELRMLATMLGVGDASSPDGLTGLSYWIVTVRSGLEITYGRYPWLAYGTDWLAFAHIIIGIFFIGPFIDPVRNTWVVYAGLIACLLVLPLALICGPIRGIPFYWRLIDCSFGVFGCLPLFYCLHLTRKMRQPGNL